MTSRPRRCRRPESSDAKHVDGLCKAGARSPHVSSRHRGCSTSSRRVHRDLRGAQFQRSPQSMRRNAAEADPEGVHMIRKLANGKYRLYSRKVDPRTGKRRNLGTFDSRAKAEKHERAVQFFKRR